MDARKKLAARFPREMKKGERGARQWPPKGRPSASPSIRMEDWLSKDLRLLLTN